MLRNSLPICRRQILQAVLFLLLALFTGRLLFAEEETVEKGVRLILSSEQIEPTTTFELRFDDAIILPDKVGLAAPESPLVSTPPLTGRFMWLSQRSGVFTPDEPPALGATYRMSLRAGLRKADGTPLTAELKRTFETPPMEIIGHYPDHGENSQKDASATPKTRLQFNVNVDAKTAAPFIDFEDATGRKVPAIVTQAEDEPDLSSEFQKLRTWRQRFDEARGAAGRKPRNEDETSKPEPLPARLLVIPAHPLPVGQGWKIVVARDLPASDGPGRLPETANVMIGDVCPFEIEEVIAHNTVDAAKSLEVVFTKSLSPEIQPADVAKWVRLEPTPADLTTEVEGDSITFTGDFSLNKRYAVIVQAGLPAEEPFTLAQDARKEAAFTPLPARLYFPAYSTTELSGGQRDFALRSVNAGNIRLRAKLLTPETLIYALDAYRDYWKKYNEPNRDEEPLREVDYEAVPGRTVFDRPFHLNKPVDSIITTPLKWDDILQKRPTGAVFLAAQRSAEQYGGRPLLGTEALVQLTDIGLVWKQNRDEEAWIYAFSMATGKPLPSVQLRALSGENQPLATATTDSNGLAHFQVPKDTNWLLAENGDDLHAIRFRRVEDSDNDYGAPDPARFLPLWHFAIPTAGYERGHQRQVLTFSDRPVYQPGETLHLKTIVRERPNDTLALPPRLTGDVQFFDARERKFAERKFTLNDVGSFAEDVALPTSGLGDYRAEVRFDDDRDRMYSFNWQVQQYKPNAFEIKIDARPSYGPGEAIELPVSARYFFGKKLSQAKLHWSLEASDEAFSTDKLPDFDFNDNEQITDDEKGARGFHQQGEINLDANGAATLKPELAIDPQTLEPRQADLLVEVTDVDQQTVSERVRFTRQSSEFYLGLKEMPELVTAGDQVPVTVVAMNADGTPHAGAVATTVRLRRIKWHVVREVGAGGALTYRSDPELTDVSTTPVTTTALTKSGDKYEADDEHPAPIILPEAGDFLLDVSAQDAAGHQVRAATRINVSSPAAAKQQTVWPYPNAAKIDLVTDQTIYRGGDTAKILVKTPISGEALVTVEREKVLRTFVVRLDGNAPSISVPLLAEDAPNVFVSVMLVRGFEESPRKIKTPDYRLGYCQINIEQPSQKLTVKVTGDAPHYQPAQTVNVTAEIRDGTGAPAANAEITLYAVDEGVLSLMGYKTPDPYAFFNAPRPLRVQTGSSLPSLFPEDPGLQSFSNKGYLIGGGGEDEGGSRLRRNFLACAFWNAELHTDADGKVSASFPAPDSLTRYRVIAVAQTAGNQFGSGESSFEVNKPLMLEPALPRFANVGDRLQLRAVLHNTTDAAGEVELTVKLDQTASLAGSENGGGLEFKRSVPITALGSVSVDFPVDFKEAGTATFAWHARMADAKNPGSFLADAVETKLNVGYVAPLLHETLLGRTNATAGNLFVQANPQFLEGAGKFTARVANTRLSELNDAVHSLLHYPYGCVEQTASSMLPWIIADDLRKGVPQLRVDPAQADDAILHGVNRLLEMQTPSGGLAYWPGGREPMLWGSAYGAMTLALAQKHGHPVPVATLDQICKYISQELRNTAEKQDNYELSDRCLAVYALALAGHAEAGYHELLWKKRDALSAENRALVALAIMQVNGPAAMVADLIDPKKPAPPQAQAWFSSGARELAVRLLAWTAHDPKNLAVDTLAEELLHARNSGGNWGTTQGNAWALLALSRYAAEVEGAPKLATGSLHYASVEQPFRLDENVHVVEMEHAILPNNEPLQLTNPDQAQLFTQVQMEARPRVGLQPRQDRGYAISRNYSKLNDDGSSSAAKDLHVGDRVLVTLQVEVREAAHYLALDDPLPAIFEAVIPVFKSQEIRGERSLGRESFSDYRELREDRALFFANHVAPNTYTIRYLARVRAAGSATAPAAKIEEMYHPERFGLTETVPLQSAPAGE